MLALNDPTWPTLRGGYHTPFDASSPLRSLVEASDLRPVWEELWDGLHHQGDVGEASYAAVPNLVYICGKRKITDWNLFALPSAVEICRWRPQNPPLPSWLEDSYGKAWDQLFELGLGAIRSSNDQFVAKAVLGVIAIHKGLRQIGRLLAESDAGELREMYERLFPG